MQLLYAFLIFLFSAANAQMDYNSTLKIPKDIPKNTFVIHTLIDRETVEYSEDNGATGQCKNQLHRYGSINIHQLAGPCLTTIDNTTEQSILATCRKGDDPTSITGDSIHIDLYIDDDTGKPTVDMSFTAYNHNPNAFYGFGSEPSDTPLHSEAKTFVDPGPVILINCVNNKRTPIVG